MRCTTNAAVQRRRRALTDANAWQRLSVWQPEKGIADIIPSPTSSTIGMMSNIPIVPGQRVTPTSSTIGVPLPDSDQWRRLSWTTSFVMQLPGGGIVEEWYKHCSFSGEPTSNKLFVEWLLNASGAGPCTVHEVQYDCTTTCYKAFCKSRALDAPKELFEHIYSASELRSDKKAAVMLRYLRDHEGIVSLLSCPSRSGDVAVCSCNEELLEALQSATMDETSATLPEAFRKAGEELQLPTRNIHGR